MSREKRQLCQLFKGIEAMNTTQKETYQELKKRHSDEFSAFPIAFAFSKEQFEEALSKLDAKADECCSIGGGGIIKKTDSKALQEFMNRHVAELENAFKIDAVLIEAIIYELGNHEYSYTYDPADTIEALDLDMNDERVVKCFQAAKKQYLADNEG